jgi:hypothetical protein
MCARQVTCFGVWKNADARGSSRTLVRGGKLLKICVLTLPGLTAYAVMCRSSDANLLCSSSTCSTLQSFDLAYWVYLHACSEMGSHAPSIPFLPSKMWSSRSYLGLYGNGAAQKGRCDMAQADLASACCATQEGSQQYATHLHDSVP